MNQLPEGYIYTAKPEEIKAELEGRYDINLYARTINGTHRLTQWTPIYIDVSWNDMCPIGSEGYWLSIAKNDHTKHHMYQTPWIETGKKDTLEKVIAEIGVWCKKAKPKQIALF